MAQDIEAMQTMIHGTFIRFLFLFPSSFFPGYHQQVSRWYYKEKWGGGGIIPPQGANVSRVKPIEINIIDIIIILNIKV